MSPESTSPAPWPPSQPITVAITYPTAWYGDPAGFAAEVGRLEALDPRVRVVVVPYLEDDQRRSTRRTMSAAELAALPVELTPEAAAALATVDAALGLDLPPEVARHLPRLRWFQVIGSGSDHVPSAGLGAVGARLTSSTGANAVSIAEFALGRLIAHEKRFAELAAAQADAVWRPATGRQLAGRRLGLIGLGAINEAVARRAAAFDMEVWAVRRQGAAAPPVTGVARVLDPTQLHDMLAGVHAVIAAVPDSPDTRHLMDRAAFAAMAPGSFFCNVGRGSLVDEDALADALESGHLSGAALDVTSVEPLPPESRLWSVPNLALSPHCSVAVGAMFANTHRIFADNLRRFLAGEPMVNERTTAP